MEGGADCYTLLLSHRDHFSLLLTGGLCRVVIPGVHVLNNLQSQTLLGTLREYDFRDCVKVVYYNVVLLVSVKCMQFLIGVY